MSATEPHDATAMTHREILVVFAGLMTGLFLVSLGQTIVTTALPTIAGELGGVDLIAWIVTAYLLAATAATPLFGRISDLYPRDRVFQAAIGIFLLGSVLCGIAVNMPMLIGARAVQGIGGGGVMALVMTIIGDILSPRERGRYQGYIGAVLGVSSVVGPLVGGLLVDLIDWRWVFFVNLPIGAAALVVTGRVLRLPHQRIDEAIDYLGAVLLVTGVSALLLVAAWGGSEHAWTSPTILWLGVAGVLLSLLFVLRQRVAPAPLLPLRLFSSRTFSVVAAGGFIVGATMFGAIVFLPVFLQLVAGASATQAGLILVPLMGGLVVSSAISGRLITRTGRYKIYPVLGTALMALALWLLSTMGTGTRMPQVAVYAALLGTGIGMVLQNLTLAAQNAVEARDLGIATATANFTRTLGASIGTAIFGAIMAAGLTARLTGSVADDIDVDPSALQGSPQTILALEPEAREVVVAAFSGAVSTVFLVGVPLALLACLLLLLLPELPLRRTRHVGSGREDVPVTGVEPSADPVDSPPSPSGADGPADHADTAERPPGGGASSPTDRRPRPGRHTTSTPAEPGRTRCRE